MLKSNFGLGFDLNFDLCFSMFETYSIFSYVWLCFAITGSSKERKPFHKPFSHQSIAKEAIHLLSFDCLTNGFCYVFKKESEAIEANIRAVTLRRRFLSESAFVPPPQWGHLGLSVDIHDDQNWECYWLLKGKSEGC